MDQKKISNDNTQRPHNVGIDPELIGIGVQMAIYHIERGVRKYYDFAARMVNDCGEKVIPYLRYMYISSMSHPSIRPYVKEMESVETVEAIDDDDVRDYIEYNIIRKPNNTPDVNILDNEIEPINQTMRAIETPWAMTALWQMAEHLPVVLVEMSKDEPKELLKEIEHKVEMALQWKETVITENMMTEDQALEFMPQLLEPNYCPPKPAKLKVTEKMMQDIVKILMAEAAKEIPETT